MAKLPVTKAKPFTQPMTIAGQVEKPKPKSTVFTEPMTISGQVKKPVSIAKKQQDTLANLTNIEKESAAISAETDALVSIADASATEANIAELEADALYALTNPKDKIEDKIYTAPDGTTFTDQAAYVDYLRFLGEDKDAFDIANRAGQSAYDILYTKFAEMGLGSLVQDVKKFITAGISTDELTLRLREQPSYKARFIANPDRIAKGLTPLTEAEYLDLEDQYQYVMRQYGLPDTYWKKGNLGTQESFTKLIANDVSNVELEDRIQTAQDRVINANPEVTTALKQFYPDITNGDILAYTLDPKNALKNIQRKVSAAEIGGAALQAGLNLGQTPEQIAQYAAKATELAGAGITKAQAQQGFQTVAEVAPRGGQLAEIYKQSPYTQQTAEAEVFGTAGSVEAAKQRKKLTGLEKAAFSTATGMAKGALDRERAGNL